LIGCSTAVEAGGQVEGVEARLDFCLPNECWQIGCSSPPAQAASLRPTPAFFRFTLARRRFTPDRFWGVGPPAHLCPIINKIL